MSILDKSLISQRVDLTSLTRVLYVVHVPERVLVLYDANKKGRKPSFVSTTNQALDQNLFSREVKLKFTIEKIAEIIDVEPTIRFNKLDDIINICLAIYEVLPTIPNASTVIPASVTKNEVAALHRIVDMYNTLIESNLDRIIKRFKGLYKDMGDEQPNAVLAKRYYNIADNISRKNLVGLGPIEIDFILEDLARKNK